MAPGASARATDSMEAFILTVLEMRMKMKMQVAMQIQMLRLAWLRRGTGDLASEEDVNAPTGERDDLSIVVSFLDMLKM